MRFKKVQVKYSFQNLIGVDGCFCEQIPNEIPLSSASLTKFRQQKQKRIKAKMHRNCLDFGIRKHYKKISSTYNSIELNLPPFCRLGSASLRRRRLSFFRSVPGYSCTRAGRRKPKIRYPSDFGSASVYGKDAIVGFLSDSALKQKKVQRCSRGIH